jgi:DNA-binding response OmpR family regulator
MHERVLIVDDEEKIRQMIRLTLEAASYEVGEAENGMEASFILSNDPKWNVILLDQRLPVVDGTEILPRLRVLAPSAHVVMMTAYASVELAVEAMKLGATDFLRKPMTPEIVRNAVAAALSTGEVKPHEVQRPQKRTVTMNGFTILRDSDIDGASLNEKRFLVRKPDGREQEIVVEISEQALRDAQQLVRGQVIDKAFWTAQAEIFLRDFIWNDGNVPTGGRLILKGIDQEDLSRLYQHQREDDETSANH